MLIKETKDHWGGISLAEGRINKFSEKSDDGHKDVWNRVEQDFFCDHYYGMEGPEQGGSF